MYINNQKISSKEFNIVPCSTLFYENGKSEEEIIINVEEKINNIEFNKIKVLCINNILLDLLLDFFEVKKDEE